MKKASVTQQDGRRMTALIEYYERVIDLFLPQGTEKILSIAEDIRVLGIENVFNGDAPKDGMSLEEYTEKLAFLLGRVLYPDGNPMREEEHRG